jgi:PAS domain S-box-containing protein
MYMYWVIDFFKNLTNDRFMPHGMCYQWEPVTLWSNVIGDALTSFSYFMIPAFLIYFVSKRKKIEMQGLFLMFAIFIISCGAVHAISAVNVWIPYYNLAGFMKLTMAGVSLATVFLMYLNMPEALKIPSPTDLQIINDQLTAEIKEKTRLQNELEQQRTQLQRTIKLLNSTQEAAKIGSWRVDFKTGESYWSNQVYRIHGLEPGSPTFLRDSINFYREDFQDRVNDVVKEAQEEGKSWDEEWVLVDTSGKELWVRTTGYPTYDDGEVVGIEGLIIDIDQQKRAAIALEEQTDELQKSNAELESFSYSVSHDMRAPLRAINGYAEILKEEYAERLDDEGNRLLNIVHASAIKLGELIDDILAFSRLGREELDKRPVVLEELTHQVVNEVAQSPYWNESVKIEIEKIPNCSGDEPMLKQAFYNLIENALKYSSTEEHIEIRVGSLTENGEIIYFIKDNGIGINMEYKDKIFGVFQRLHSAKTFEGTGVGLAIVRKIIERHGGKIWLESEEGVGSTFYFNL